MYTKDKMLPSLIARGKVEIILIVGKSVSLQALINTYR